MYRRLESSKVNEAGNAHVKHAPEDALEMSSGIDSTHAYSTIPDAHSEAGAYDTVA